jgi:hypothetical protein
MAGLLPDSYEGLNSFVWSRDDDSVVFHIPLTQKELVPDWDQLNNDFKEGLILYYPGGEYFSVECIFRNSDRPARIVLR